jgi:hypothetical protein
MLSRSLLYCLAIPLIVISAAANADSVTYDFTGTIASASGAYATATATGPVTGSVTFDLAAENPTQGFGAISTMSAWSAVSHGGPQYGTSLPSVWLVSTQVTAAGISFTTPTITASLYQVDSSVEAVNASLGSEGIPNEYNVNSIVAPNATDFTIASLRLIGPGAPFTANPTMTGYQSWHEKGFDPTARDMVCSDSHNVLIDASWLRTFPKAITVDVRFGSKAEPATNAGQKFVRELKNSLQNDPLVASLKQDTWSPEHTASQLK